MFIINYFIVFYRFFSHQIIFDRTLSALPFDHLMVPVNRNSYAASTAPIVWDNSENFGNLLASSIILKNDKLFLKLLHVLYFQFKQI
jgi:hypothetical protein